jgi:hypothetical protein
LNLGQDYPKVFHGFPQFLQANSGTTRLGHDHFLPNPFQYISLNNHPPTNRKYWKRRQKKVTTGNTSMWKCEKYGPRYLSRHVYRNKFSWCDAFGRDGSGVTITACSLSNRLSVYVQGFESNWSLLKDSICTMLYLDP